MGVKVEFDPVKNAGNIQRRGLSFEMVSESDFETALYYPDNRKDYAEQRVLALGYLGSRIHVLVFSEGPEGLRVISFRKANKREKKRYEQEARSRIDR